MTPFPFPDRFLVLLLCTLTLGMVSSGEQAAGGGRAPGLPGTRVATTTEPRVSILKTSMRLQDGDTVGVGMPIILRFSTDVAPEHRLELIDHIRVTSVPAVI